MTPQGETALIIYDGDCIFCQSYVQLLRLRDTVGKVELLDARSKDPRVTTLQQQGFDLNEGMLFVYKGEVHHGSDAVHRLALLSSASGFANRMNRLILSNRATSAGLYPVLKAGRRVTLFLRGRRQIPDPPDPGS